MPLSMENGWDEWPTTLSQFLLPTLTSFSWFPWMATRIGRIEGRDQSGHIQFLIIFLGYKSWFADVCSNNFPKNSPCFFLLQITGKPAIFHGTSSWQVSKSQAIRCWTILSRDNQGKAAFAAGQLSTESLNWDLFCWWLMVATFF